jgi:hypothetical protein
MSRPITTFGNGFLGQIDVGRYLAGDTGATITLDREFANGWKVGAFATFTCQRHGIRRRIVRQGHPLTIPMNWLLGQPSARR